MLGCRKSGTLTSSRHFPDTSGLCRLCFPFCVLRSSRAKRWFVKLALAVATSFAVLRAGFVQGLGWDQSRPVKVCTRVLEGSSGHGSDRAARKLTINIKAAKSSNELIRLLGTATEDSYFNHFHASAAYHKLARFHRNWSFSQANDLVLAKLHSRVQRMVERNELDEQGSANVLWGLAKFLDAGPEALKLIRSLASLIPRQTSKMSPRDLSNCLWAAAQLEDLEPSVLKMVPAIIAKIASTGGKTNLQDVANNLDALVSLQGSVAEVGPLLAPGQSGSFLRRAADRLNRGLPQLQGTDLYMNMPLVVWACARSGLHDHPLFVSVAERFTSSAQPSKLPDWDLCALAWAYQVVDPEKSFEDFQQALELEINRRGFSASKVESSKVGSSRWGRASV